MMEVVGWIQVVVVIGVVAAVGGAVVSAAVMYFAGDLIEAIEPNRRFWVLSAVVMLPLVAAAAALVVSFYPALLHGVGLLNDHCRVHGGQSIYLCFIHHSAPPIAAWVTAASLAVLAGMASYSAYVVRRELQVHLRSKRLLQVARYDEDLEVCVAQTESLWAMTIGLLRPEIVISEQLVESLSTQQQAAVIAHETSHRGHRDGLRAMLFRAVSAVHLPGTRRQLRDAMELAIEQRCDRAAAREVDDKITVAEAIVAVVRGRQPQAVAPANGRRFCNSNIEKRVAALLKPEKHWSFPTWWILGLICAVSGTAMSWYLHDLHHLVEHAIGWLV